MEEIKNLNKFKLKKEYYGHICLKFLNFFQFNKLEKIPTRT